MTAADYQRVRGIFHEVFGLEDAALARRLDELCGDDDATRLAVLDLLDGLRAADSSWGLDARDDLPRIEGFRITGVLGEGGMGTVYRAEQREPRRNVALKVIRGTLVSDQIVRRFRREAEVLARLSHPGIAPIHAVGIDRSTMRATPYLVMELVEGVTLTEHARTVSLRARLKLLAEVCDAVHHAHLRGVVHRDLKPANILVDRTGRPRVLDFGIARLVAADVPAATLQTEAGQLLGTVAYMSPEQAGGDPAAIDHRSDVYALGVLLYEVLVDRLPHETDGLPVLDALRAVRESEHTRLSSIDARLRGDLETMVGKALEKEPDRRYQSAELMAADIRRHLADEPILAHPPSTLYQLRKFTRRNRAFVVGLAAVFVALLAGLIATGAALRRESAARANAERALAQADASTAFLRQVLIGTGPRWARGRDTGVLAEMVDESRAAIPEVEFGNVRGDLYALLGEVYVNIFDYEEAHAVLEEAVAAYEAIGASDGTDALLARLLLGGTLQKLGRMDESAAVRRDVLASIESGRGDPSLLSRTLQEYANLQVDRGEWEEAARLTARALALAVETGDAIDEARASMTRGAALRRLGRLDEAEAAYARAHEIYGARERSALEASTAINSLAVIARQRGDMETAERRFRESLARRREIDPRPNPDTAAVLSNLGRLLARLGRTDEARPVLEESIAMHEAIYDEGYFGTAYPVAGLALVASRTGDHERAETLYGRALAIWRGYFGDRHVVVAKGLTEVGDARRRAADPAAAETAYREALAIADELSLDAELYRRPIVQGLAAALTDQGRLEEARLLSEGAGGGTPPPSASGNGD